MKDTKRENCRTEEMVLDRWCMDSCRKDEVVRVDRVTVVAVEWEGKVTMGVVMAVDMVMEGAVQWVDKVGMGVAMGMDTVMEGAVQEVG